jgi:zinc D-Ala-D-Ala carboxypeptidase
MKTLYTVTNWPSQRWPNFAQREMICSYSGECWLDPASMNALQRLRDTVGVPLPISSGYRSPDHPVEISKERGGSHTLGKAFDVACRGATAYEVIAAAKDCGFTGIGVNQSSEGRFIHLDTITELDNFPAERPTIWSY